jgi:hypothetical protein
MPASTLGAMTGREQVQQNLRMMFQCRLACVVGLATITSFVGSRIVKVDPRPGSFSTVMSPPIIWQKRRLMTRPRPVPPYLLDVDEDACENSWNGLPICSPAADIACRSSVSCYLVVLAATSPHRNDAYAPGFSPEDAVNVAGYAPVLVTRFCRPRLACPVVALGVFKCHEGSP